MCKVAYHLDVVGKEADAVKQYEKARDVGAAHGFFSVECGACLPLIPAVVERLWARWASLLGLHSCRSRIHLNGNAPEGGPTQPSDLVLHGLHVNPKP